jgi:IS1 family transposase
MSMGMNRLPLEKRTQIIGMLCEGMSMRACSRLADVSINTVTKLLVEVGDACAAYQFNTLTDLPCQRVQVDEIWAFVGAKERNASAEQKLEGFGDIWLWTSICADTKLIPTWWIGDRNQHSATGFALDLAQRLRTRRPQITSDGLAAYRPAIERAFGDDVDFAQMVKQYETPYEAQRRYSPPICTGATKITVQGNPDPDHISTSFVERSNLTLRMSCRRYTRLTNAFSKKVENHARAVALHMMHYNFARIHKSLRVTPAMAAGVTDHVWSIAEIAALSDAAYAAPKTRGPYKKRARAV